MASAATPMRRPAFKDITNGVGRVEGEDLLDLTTAELKNQWKLRGIKGHSKLSGDVKGALVKALWPDAPSRPVAPSTTKRKRSENIFRVAHDDELERESHEQLVKRIRKMEEVGEEIWKQREAERKTKLKRIANLLANGTLPADASKLTIETLNTFCEHDGVDDGNHTGRGCEQRKRKFIDLVDTLGGGEYRQEHEDRVVKRRCFSARKLAELTDSCGGLNYEAIDRLRGALGETGTRERRNTSAAIVPTRSAAQKVNKTLDEHLQSRGSTRASRSPRLDGRRRSPEVRRLVSGR